MYALKQDRVRTDHEMARPTQTLLRCGHPVVVLQAVPNPHDHPQRPERREEKNPVRQYCDFPDGTDPLNRAAYQFHGWRVLAWVLLHQSDRHTPHDHLAGLTKENTYQNMLRDEELLHQAGYTMKTVWECEWSTLQKDDKTVCEFVANLHVVAPLHPREAFYGGRTNAIKLFHIAEEGEHIHYVQFTSRYSWVNKYSLPFGLSDHHPKPYQRRHLSVFIIVFGDGEVNPERPVPSHVALSLP